MTDLDTNPLIRSTATLRAAKKQLLADPTDEKAVKQATEVLEAPFNIRIPLGSTVIDDEDVIQTAVADGIKLLAQVHGFSDVADEAAHLLRCHFNALLKKMLQQYKASEERRQEKIPTAFKSSVQHVLCSNLISDPGQLQLHFLRHIYPPAVKIATWWDRYLKQSPEEREKMVKLELGEPEEALAAAPEEAKRGRRRKNEEEGEKAVKKPKKEEQTDEDGEDDEEGAQEEQPVAVEEVSESLEVTRTWKCRERRQPKARKTVGGSDANDEEAESKKPTPSTRGRRGGRGKKP